MTGFLPAVSGFHMPAYLASACAVSTAQQHGHQSIEVQLNLAMLLLQA